MPIFTIEHHHFFHGDPAVATALADIRAGIQQLLERGNTMSAQLDALQAANTALIAEVARNTAVDESAIVLLNGLSAQLIAAKDDPVAIQAIADSMGSKTNELGVSSNALAASIIANTPAA